MRTSEGRYAGAGITLAFTETNEIWRDKKVKHVKFPNDGKVYAATTIRECTINDLDEETKIRYNLH